MNDATKDALALVGGACVVTLLFVLIYFATP
jgi:hypothetical protein